MGVAVTEVAVTEVAVTEVAVTEVAVTEEVAAMEVATEEAMGAAMAAVGMAGMAGDGAGEAMAWPWDLVGVIPAITAVVTMGMVRAMGATATRRPITTPLTRTTITTLRLLTTVLPNLPITVRTEGRRQPTRS